MKLDDIKKLHQKKYRYQMGLFLVEGEHLILELEKAAQHNVALQTSELFVTEQFQNWNSPFKTQVISAKHMAQISDTRTPPGIMAVVPLSYASAMACGGQGERAIYLHEIQDPGNLGTILRTLAWFGGFRCLLSPGSVDPYNPKVVRASMGAIFHINLELEVSLASLNQRFPKIACLDIQGQPLSAPAFQQFNCYLFGNEARGIPREQLSQINTEAFSIQGGGAIESLNLATAVNMCAYELHRHIG